MQASLEAITIYVYWLTLIIKIHWNIRFTGSNSAIECFSENCRNFLVFTLKSATYVERVGDGSRRWTGTGAPFRDKLSRLYRKGGLRAGSSINAPLRDKGGGGGLSRKSVCSSLLNQTLYNFFHFFRFVCCCCHLAGSSFFVKFKMAWKI